MFIIVIDILSGPLCIYVLILFMYLNSYVHIGKNSNFT